MDHGTPPSVPAGSPPSTITVRVGLAPGEIDITLPANWTLNQASGMASELCVRAGVRVWISITDIWARYRLHTTSDGQGQLVGCATPPNYIDEGVATADAVGLSENRGEMHGKWIGYRKAKSDELRRDNPEMSAAEISRVVSTMWKYEGPEARVHWEARAHRMHEGMGRRPDLQDASSPTGGGNAGGSHGKKDSDKSAANKVTKVKAKQIKSKARSTHMSPRADDKEELVGGDKAEGLAGDGTTDNTLGASGLEWLEGVDISNLETGASREIATADVAFQPGSTMADAAFQPGSIMADFAFHPGSTMAGAAFRPDPTMADVAFQVDTAMELGSAFQLDPDFELDPAFQLDPNSQLDTAFQFDQAFSLDQAFQPDPAF